MSTGFKGKFHRQNTISRFVKDLVRRSRSHCELCDKSGVKLEAYEVLPLPEEPRVDQCVFICDGCRKQILDPGKMIPSYWRCLTTSLYSEVPVVQVLAYRILRRLSAKNERWAEELMENAYMDPDLESWARESE